MKSCLQVIDVGMLCGIKGNDANVIMSAARG